MIGVSTLDPWSTLDIVQGPDASNAGPLLHQRTIAPPARVHATGSPGQRAATRPAMSDRIAA